MTVRAYVTFEDALTPATPVSDAEDWESPPPGRALADDLAGGLQAKGLALAFPVSQWEAYGWEFTVKSDGRDVWFMLQSTTRDARAATSGSTGTQEPSGEWLVMSDVPRGFREKLRAVQFEEQHNKALSALASVLAQPRFTNVQWFTKAEFEHGEGSDGSDA